MHNDYSLAPEKVKVTKEMLSEYQLEIIEDNKFPYGRNEKRISNLGHKKYKLHYENLKLYLELGLKLKKVHRVLEFKQTPFLKPYIKRNTELRKQPEKEGNKIKKQNAKVRKNVISGKSIENSINRFDV